MSSKPAAGQIDEYEIITPPYPETSPKDIVIKSYEGTKPFKNDGSGHKDYLIWRTITKYVEENSAKVPRYFLTGNVADFCEKLTDKTGEHFKLHPDLTSDLSDGVSLEIYTSLKMFFDDIIATKLEGIDIADIPELGVEQIDDRVQEILENDLDFYSTYGFQGLPFSNDVTVTSIQDISIDDHDLKAIDEEEILITVTGQVGLEVDGFLDKHDFYHADDQKLGEIYISEPDWNDHVMAVSSTIYTPFEISLSYSKSEKMITGHTINLPEEISDDIY